MFDRLPTGLMFNTGVLLIGAVIFHWLERRNPVHTTYKTGPGNRRAYLADFIALIVDGPVLSGFVKALSLHLITLLPETMPVLKGWPWLAQFALFFFVNDFGRYWLHRWYHESDLLWRIHRVHHTVVQMDAFSTFRVHVLEGAIKYGLLILPFRLLGIDRWVMILYTSFDILKGFWHHANLRTYIGPLNYVFNSAEQHWWHHSVEARGQRANYGSVLSIWDILFGTFYWPRGKWPTRIGVDGMERFPDHYLGQFASIRYNDEQMIRTCNGEQPAPPEPPPLKATVQRES